MKDRVTPLLKRLILMTLLAAGCRALAQETKNPYPTMAPIDQYLMDRDAEIAMARSAAPASIAKDATVMVLTRHGYETAVAGKNGFVCMVERSWNSAYDFPEFWNPKMRGPDCLNAAAARSYLPLTVKKAELALAGKTRVQIQKAIESAIDNKQLPLQTPGAMSYMLSKQGYLNDGVGHWHPHVMFFVPLAEAAAAGAEADDSPIMEMTYASDRLAILMFAVGKWSDGTADSMKME